MKIACVALAAALAAVGCVSAQTGPGAVDQARQRVTSAVRTAEVVPVPEQEPEPVLPETPPKEPPAPVSYVAPYDHIEVMSDHWDCRRRRYHGGYDLYGEGENGGLGTPVVSIGTARVVTVGRPGEDPASFGTLLRRRGTTVRGGRRYPTNAYIKGYGRVRFFTRYRGSWRSGAVVVTELLEGPWSGYTARYMHLGAVLPELQVGSLLKPGTEIGVLGGTGIQESTPHLHVDLEDPDGNRVDLAPVLGIAGRAKDDIPVCGRRRRSRS